MSDIPTLYTPRLTLRPFSPVDGARVQFLAGDARVAATTAAVPHPYPDGAAEQWIATHAGAAKEGKAFTFAITLAGTRTPGREHDVRDTGHVIGTIHVGAEGNPAHQRGVLGYWIGVPYWNKGFATEAGRAVLEFAFGKLAYHRVLAWHLASNSASGRVLQKLGMTREGLLQDHVQKNGVFHNVVCYGLLSHEWRLKQYKPAYPRLRVPRAELAGTSA